MSEMGPGTVGLSLVQGKCINKTVVLSHKKEVNEEETHLKVIFFGSVIQCIKINPNIKILLS